jgi:hypothetical protein
MEEYVLEFYFFGYADEGAAAAAVVPDVVLPVLELYFGVEAGYEFVQY